MYDLLRLKQGDFTIDDAIRLDNLSVESIREKYIKNKIPFKSN